MKANWQSFEAGVSNEVTKQIDYNITVLRLLQNLHLRQTDITRLQKIRQKEELISAFIELLIPNGDRNIESARVAAELCAVPLIQFCLPNYISLPLTCSLLWNWICLLLSMVSVPSADLHCLIEKALCNVCAEVPGLSESMVELLRTFFARCSGPFIALYSTILTYKAPARHIVTDVPLPVVTAQIPSLSDFTTYEAALVAHEEIFRQQNASPREAPQDVIDVEAAQRERESLTQEDKRSLLLKTHREPSQAEISAQREHTLMHGEDMTSTALSAAINEHHRLRDEEYTYINTVTENLRAPTEKIMENLLVYKKQVMDQDTGKRSGK